MGAILLTLLLLQRSEEAAGPWSGHAQTRSKQRGQGGGRQETECSNGSARARRVAAAEERALFGKPITACKVAPRAPGESQTREQPGARG